MFTSEEESAYESYGKYAQHPALRSDTVTTTGWQKRYLVELIT